MAKGIPKILVVDDEPDVCKFVQSYFGRRDMDVSTTPSGTEALTMIREIKPDIILLDNLLEDITGIEVLQSLREFDKEVKVVLVTGCEFSEQKEKEIRDIGITEYLHKPLVLEDLADVIYSILKNQPIRKIKKREQSPDNKKRDSKGSIGHKLSNLLGIIRNKCENFTWNLEDGIYEDKTDKDLVNMSSDVMKEVIQAVDRATEVIDEIKKNESK